MKLSEAQSILRMGQNLAGYADELNIKLMDELEQSLSDGREPIGLCATLSDVDVINDHLGIQISRIPGGAPKRNHFAGKPMRVGDPTHWVFSSDEWDELEEVA
jgi:hypothetical protein